MDINRYIEKPWNHEWKDNPDWNSLCIWQVVLKAEKEYGLRQDYSDTGGPSSINSSSDGKRGCKASRYFLAYVSLHGLSTVGKAFSNSELLCHFKSTVSDIYRPFNLNVLCTISFPVLKGAGYIWSYYVLLH